MKTTKKPRAAAQKKSVKIVVVRTVYAGVHIGELIIVKGQSVTLANARRLWRWRGANTLHEVAIHGVEDGYTRLSEPLPTIELTTAIEILPVSKAAVPSLSRSRWAQ